MRIKHPEEFAILPADPLFRKDDECLPIQAADLWAWCLRKNTDEPAARSFEWLLAEMPNVIQARYCNYYDLERMSNVNEESLRIAKAGEIPSELLPMYEAITRHKKP